MAAPGALVTSDAMLRPLQVWDRRALRGNRPAGVLVGHTEGITHLDSRDDGRYLLSNCKDQTARLWDIRKVPALLVASVGHHWEPQPVYVGHHSYALVLYLHPPLTASWHLHHWHCKEPLWRLAPYGIFCRWYMLCLN